MTDIATFTNEQLIAVCRADVAEMSKFLKEGEFSNPSRAAMYLRITEIALAALMGEFSFARIQVRREHAEWSHATFGNVGPAGPLKHLSIEALEAAAEPNDHSEWADMQFLLWDAQRRAGITDEQITQAMIDKLAVNKQREWPEPKDGEPRLHIKSQPAPVITFYRDGIEAAAKWIDQQREAYDSEHGWSDPDTGAFEFGNDAQRGYSSTLEELAEGIRALHPNAGNSPVITDRWIPVSEKLPERGDYLVSDGRDFDVQLFNGEQFIPGFVWEDKITHWMPLPATPQEVK
ncbi:DUF550 domain-containing protein [Klebsiella michiganensis]|nr:dATP/dGTP pyrophosphohydrolase domain-containing protein [Klebsiella michiganensis]POT69798.1 DUF550 domain-containing protein [Klebsiella michiganensis]